MKTFTEYHNNKTNKVLAELSVSSSYTMALLSEGIIDIIEGLAKDEKDPQKLKNLSHIQELLDTSSPVFKAGLGGALGGAALGGLPGAVVGGLGGAAISALPKLMNLMQTYIQENQPEGEPGQPPKTPDKDPQQQVDLTMAVIEQSLSVLQEEINKLKDPTLKAKYSQGLTSLQASMKEMAALKTAPRPGVGGGGMMPPGFASIHNLPGN